MKALMKQSIALSGLLTLSALSSANADRETPTFYTDALPVFQKNCVACHQDNGPDVGGIRRHLPPLSRVPQAGSWKTKGKIRSL